MSAVGATVPNLSGCFAHSLQYWCAGAALLAKALACGREGAAFGKCAACGGFTVGLDEIQVVSFVVLHALFGSPEVGCYFGFTIFYLVGASFYLTGRSFTNHVASFNIL
jgi:hypothetical protein